MRKKIKKLEKIEVTQKDAIHLKCLSCCCGDWQMVLECTDDMCPLYLARPKRRRDALKSKFWDDNISQFIARPVIKKRTRIMSDEQKEAAGERLRKMHLKHKRSKK